MTADANPAAVSGMFIDLQVLFELIYYSCTHKSAIMKLASVLSFLVLLTPAISFAQGNQFDQRGRGGYNPGREYRYDNMQYETSVLSVFSENGEPFFLILNGVAQNTVPQSKIRVESLPKYMTDIEIAFPNSREPRLRKTVSISDPIDGKAVNLTMRVSRGRDGHARLKFHRMTECDRNYHGPRDEYVMYYGKPQQVNTVTETSYMDPITGQWITETTTTTTTSDYNNYNNNDHNRYNNRDNNYVPPTPMAMDAQMFADAKQSILSSNFDETKLSTAKTVLSSNYVNTSQVMEICKMFSFENTKLSFAKFAYDRTVDQQNYFRVSNVFDFDASKKSLNEYVSKGKR